MATRATAPVMTGRANGAIQRPASVGKVAPSRARRYQAERSSSHDDLGGGAVPEPPVPSFLEPSGDSQAAGELQRAIPSTLSGSWLLLERLRARPDLIVFGVMGALLAAYLGWLLVGGPPALQLHQINGWVGTAFRLAAGVICLVGGLRRRPGSPIPLVFGVALIFTAIGNAILTFDSLHGPPPPPPTPADLFGIGFIVLCFVGIGLMGREDRQHLSPNQVLDGGIAALGAGAVAAAFLLDHVSRQPGETTLGAASQLVFPIGFVVLVVMVVGAAAIAGKRSRAAWVELTAAFVLLALGSALGAAVGQTFPVQILTTVQWPAATLLIAASMWTDPSEPDPLAARRGTGVWLPALACAAAIAVLVAGTLSPIDNAAIALATGALVLVMVRGISELRHETAERRRTEVDLRATEAGYRQVAEEQAALRKVATEVARGARPSEVFAIVTVEVGKLLGADLTWLRRYLPGPMAAPIAAFARGKSTSRPRIEAAWGPEHRDARLRDRASCASGRLRLAAPRLGRPTAPRHVWCRGPLDR